MPRGFIVILIVLFLILVGAVVLLSRSAGDVSAPDDRGTGAGAGRKRDWQCGVTTS